MSSKWIGAVLVVVSCAGFGFYLGRGYARQERMLRQLLSVLRLMQWELKFRLTELPELARMAARETTGQLSRVFADFARELDWHTEPDAAGCIHAAIRRSRELPMPVKGLLRRLGSSLGRFDLEGQLEGLEAAVEECRALLETVSVQRRERVRNYQTLGLCAGAALVILFV